MKRSFSIFKNTARVAILLAAVTLAAACTKDKTKPDAPILAIDKKADPIEFSAAATESHTYKVTTNQSPWDAVSNQTWCKITKTADTFTVTADENKTTTAPAEATITVTAGKATPITIKATQKAANPELSITPAPEGGKIEFPAAGETKTFKVTTNLSTWNVVSDQKWCKITKTADTFTVTADENKTTIAPAEATITVTAGKANAITIKATQMAVDATLSITPAPEGGKIEFPAEGATNTFDVTTNENEWDAQSDQTWCKVTKTADTFTVTADENKTTTAPAEATITVTAGKATPITIKATQKGADPELSITPAPEGGVVNFPAAGDAKLFLVTTTLPNWNVESDKEWCVAEKSADGKQFMLKVAKNPYSTAMEDATVTVSAEGVPDLVLTAKQAGTPASLFDDGIAPAAEYGGGDGTAEKPFLITSAAELKKLVEERRDADTKGKYYRLETDIYVTAASWVPIGISIYSEFSFHGDFDGNGHTVYGKLISDSQSTGFFGSINGDAVVRNLTVDAVIQNTGSGIHYTGAIAGCMGGNATISGCTAKGTVSNPNLKSIHPIRCFTGGIAGYVLSSSKGIIADCTNYADVFSGSGRSEGGNVECHTGGIVGEAYGTVTGCTNNGSVTGGSFTSGEKTANVDVYTGGIAGYLHNPGGVLHQCVNSGDVTGGQGTSIYTGGIAGVSEGKPYSCNSNTGKVDGQPASDGNRVGSGSITDCPDGH